MKPFSFFLATALCALLLAITLPLPVDANDDATPGDNRAATQATSDLADPDEGEEEEEEEEEEGEEEEADDEDDEDEEEEAEEDKTDTDEADEDEADTDDATDDGKSDVATPLELDGVFQAVRADAVSIQVDEWSQLSVIEAVAHGAAVQVGDVLIRLKTDKLAQAIEEAEHEIGVDQLAVTDATIKLELARRSQELALQAAAATDRLAMEELKEFVANGRGRRLKSFERSVVNAQNRLEYQAEELKQLEQMYAADDLTEETEEIILKRTRDAVDTARYSLELVQESQRQGVEFDVPRNQEQLEQSVARAALALDEARRTAPQSLERQQLQLTKQQRDLEEKKARLGRLRADFKQMTVTAPRSGVVYYGTPRRGKWADPASIEPMLQPGGMPKGRTELLTVVELRPLTVRVAVPEKSLQAVKPGTVATVNPVAVPDLSLPARVTERSAIPLGNGQFEATLELDAAAALPVELVPGMNAKVKIEAAPVPTADE